MVSIMDIAIYVYLCIYKIWPDIIKLFKSFIYRKISSNVSSMKYSEIKADLKNNVENNILFAAYSFVWDVELCWS
jgi:hypothetical protein